MNEYLKTRAATNSLTLCSTDTRNHSRGCNRHSAKVFHRRQQNRRLSGKRIMKERIATNQKQSTGPKLDVERIELANGLVLLLSENHSTPSVSIKTVVRAGSRYEPDEKVGTRINRWRDTGRRNDNANIAADSRNGRIRRRPNRHVWRLSIERRCCGVPLKRYFAGA